MEWNFVFSDNSRNIDGDFYDTFGEEDVGVTGGE